MSGSTSDDLPPDKVARGGAASSDAPALLDLLVIVDGDRGELRLPSQIAPADAISFMSQALAYVREQGLRKLMAVTTAIASPSMPSASARYLLIQDWAKAAGGRVAMAVVVPAEMIDPLQFGLTVAANAGLNACGFTNEADALAWLATR